MYPTQNIYVEGSKSVFELLMRAHQHLWAARGMPYDHRDAGYQAQWMADVEACRLLFKAAIGRLHEEANCSSANAGSSSTA